METENTAVVDVEEPLSEEVVETVETSEVQTSPENEAQQEETTDSDEVEISIDGETPSQEQDDHKEAPEWVKQVRKQNREQAREIKELQERLKAKEQAENKPLELGTKPTLAQFDYDEEKFEAALEGWHANKRRLDAEIEAEANKKKAEQDEIQKRLSEYNERKAKLKVSDYQDAEDLVSQTLNVSQQSILLQGSDNPELLVYALGRNPAKAKELAAITDPIKFAFAVSKLEQKVKVQPKKSAPPPEVKIAGTAKQVSGDAILEKLQAEADRTGDITKVLRHRMEQRNKK